MSTDKLIILVTGATNGIGYDTAYALTAASPNNHVIIGARNLEKGEKTLRELKGRSPQGSLSLIELDITLDDTIEAAAAQIKSDFGHLDVLVNNAGIVVPGAVTREVLRKGFDTNVFGSHLLSNALLPLLKQSKAPKIINVTSDLGSITMRFDPANEHYKVPVDVYRMTKAALNMLTACQHVDLQKIGGTAWAYCPGYVVSDLTGDRENRQAQGLETSETSAKGIVEIVEGQRDSEAGKFVTKYGKQYPW